MEVKELGKLKMSGKKKFSLMKVKLSLEMTVGFNIWKKSVESWLPDCISPGTSKKISVIIWGCITYHGVGKLCRMNGNIDSEKYIDILDNNL